MREAVWRLFRACTFAVVATRIGTKPASASSFEKAIE